MKTFQLIQKGDLVFDSVNSVEGIVTNVNSTTNVASITTGSPSEEEEILCRLADLTVLKKQPHMEEVVGSLAIPENSPNKYIHVKYSNDKGKTFTNYDGDEVGDWIGLYSDQSEKDSLNPTDYSWSRVVGNGLDKNLQQVKEFHEKFEHPISHSPSQMDVSRAISRSVWTGEEALVEFLHASSKDEEEFNQAYDDMIKGLEKAKKKSLQMDYYKDGVDTVVAQSDALVDALYFILGSFVELGVYPDKLFDIVQNSNMSKLFTSEDGTQYAKYRESDGKILKSPEFFPPEPALEQEIKNQLNN